MSNESPDVTITRMLLSEPFDAPATREFVNRLGSRTNLKLDLAQIDELDGAQLAMFVRRILATCVFAPPLCSLLFSMTRSYLKNNRA